MKEETCRSGVRVIQTVMETEMMGDDRELEVMKVKGIQ